MFKITIQWSKNQPISVLLYFVSFLQPHLGVTPYYVAEIISINLILAFKELQK